MKWAAAKTWLSFVTATRNSLPPATPPSFEQHRVDRRPREVRGGTGVQCVGVVAQLAVQVGDGGATRRGPDAAGVAHGAGAPLNRGCRVAPSLRAVGVSGDAAGRVGFGSAPASRPARLSVW